ncbi:class I SAM-dependent methyltransferase [Sphingobium sp. AN558]|uniref:methyltransferase n=1 Tax=Sphingobium sp. AN558 TaxID=3133442 RepID=UPI0030C1929C
MIQRLLDGPTVPYDKAGHERSSALLSLLRYLYAIEYRFVTISPASHRRVLARRVGQPGHSLHDVLGWSMPFGPGTIDPQVESLLRNAGALDEAGSGMYRSRVRVSAVHHRLFLHSAYPTDAEDAVFLGPDSYRFADLVSRELARTPLAPAARIVDIGTGSGVGAIVAADMTPAAEVFMTDINSRALELAQVNAQAAGLAITAREGRNLDGFDGLVDLAIANPPYVIDPARRAYRDGGEQKGGQISLEMTRSALSALKPGGQCILYTGSAIVNGADLLKAALVDLAIELDCRLRYDELDPDVFGEELENPDYQDVDRIAVVAAIMTKPSA